jgi:hypothetical protein
MVDVMKEINKQEKETEVQCNEGESMETRNEFITSPVMEESFELE